MTESNNPKFLATDYWFYRFEENGSAGDLDLCLQELGGYISNEIEFDRFLLDLDVYEERFNLLCQQKILKVRQECLESGRAYGEDWSIIHESLI